MPAKEKPRILVVDSSRTEAQTLLVWLQVSGGQVHCVPSSDEAVDLVRKVPIDAAFVRWDADRVDADQLTQEIRESETNADIPIIMLSFERDQELLTRGLRSGATLYLPRPFGSQELGRLVGLIREAKTKRQEAEVS